MGDIAKQFQAKGGEAAFQRDMQFAPGYRDFRIGFAHQFGEQPDLNTPDYNTRGAWALDEKPEVYQGDGRYHWTSGHDPIPFQPGSRTAMLKSPDHQTMWMQKFLDALGVDPLAADQATKNQGIATGIVPFVQDWMPKRPDGN